jgi:hypothetical protein
MVDLVGRAEIQSRRLNHLLVAIAICRQNSFFHLCVCRILYLINVFLQFRLLRRLLVVLSDTMSARPPSCFRFFSFFFFSLCFFSFFSSFLCFFSFRSSRFRSMLWDDSSVLTVSRDRLLILRWLRQPAVSVAVSWIRAFGTSFDCHWPSLAPTSSLCHKITRI